MAMPMVPWVASITWLTGRSAAATEFEVKGNRMRIRRDRICDEISRVRGTHFVNYVVTSTFQSWGGGKKANGFISRRDPA